MPSFFHSSRQAPSVGALTVTPPLPTTCQKGSSTALYADEPSELRTGEIVYDAGGVPTIQNEALLIAKVDIGDVLLEPQDFAGANDAWLVASAYGPAQQGSDLVRVHMDGSGFDILQNPQGGYAEFEGVSHDGAEAFVEIDPDAAFFPGLVDLYRYRFDTGEYTLFSTTTEGEMFEPAYPHEPVFSPDGRWALSTTALGWGVDAWPGWGNGVLLWDLSRHRTGVVPSQDGDAGP